MLVTEHCQRLPGGAGNLLLGDLPEPTGCGPGHPALVILAGAGAGPGDLQRFLPTSVSL